MKIKGNSLLILYCLLALAACKQEIVAPEQQISGKFALDDGTGLTGEYIEFSNGKLSINQFSEPFPFVDRFIWDNGKAHISNTHSNSYMLVDGILTSGGKNYGHMALDGELLRIGNNAYENVQGFKDIPYSVIHLNNNSFEHTMQGGEYSFPVMVENPLPAGKLSAISSDSWISGITLKDGEVIYEVSPSKYSRTGTIKINYTHSREEQVHIYQKPTAYIKLEETFRHIGYKSTQVEIPYTIERPVEGAKLTVSSSADWVQVNPVQNDRIVLIISENNSGASRVANITCSYTDAEDMVFVLTQDWAESSIILSPSSTNVEYTGGNRSFTFEVQNPRENTSINVTSQGDWITNVELVGNSVSCKVKENNSGYSRTGWIRLTYGSHATSLFTVAQEGHPVTTLSLNKTSINLLTGASEQLIVTVYPSDAPLIWSSNRTSVATVSNGTITAQGNGTAIITVKSEDGRKSVSCNVYVTTAVTSVSLDKTNLSLAVGQSETLIATVFPSTASNKSVEWSSSLPSVATVTSSGKVTAIKEGTTTITVKTLDGSKKASCVVKVIDYAVDLGLNVKWATCNIGEDGFVSSPEEFGDYYALGETSAKSDYSWSTYKWCNGTGDTLTKYCSSSEYGYNGFTDNKTVLDPEDDVAHVKLGGKWRMPTMNDWSYLRMCTCTWTENYNNTGVGGWIVQGRGTGNSIFFPAAGYWAGTSYHRTTPDGNPCGFYWTTFIMSWKADVYEFYSNYGYRPTGRYFGYSVRPVYEE